ncbi:peptidoglycan DD-metalloendopeptidase family protein [Actinoplanes sp. NPDC051346]|uniref:M23 family metallopeptidase n=1 Tax=Actinoplanes sp. NPDC051346 TaxID=3155048 RepID=UPI0034417A3D
MILIRRLSGLTALAVCLAGCASTAGGVPEAATPQLVRPAAAIEPVPRVASGAVPANASSAAITVSKPATTHRYAFPVRASNVSFHKTHSGYPATDIFAACGKSVVATTSGVVLEISKVDKYVKGKPDGPRNGGKFVSIKGDDGVRYYGSHLSKVQSGIKPGVRVKTGQVLGKVGHTGNASGVCHLHYGISPPCKKTGDWKVRRGVVWPATYLSSWRKGGKKSPAAAVKAWNNKHHCKA